MKRYVFFLLLLGWLPLVAVANDFGKEVVGKMEVQLYYGINKKNQLDTKKLLNADAKTVKRLQSLGAQKFRHYYYLGKDAQSVFRSYENWLAPLKPSEEVLLSFEPRGDAKEQQLMIDLEFWQSRKKVMKTGQTLTQGVPLYIYGPQWRGGRLIFSITLVELK